MPKVKLHGKKKIAQRIIAKFFQDGDYTYQGFRNVRTELREKGLTRFISSDKDVSLMREMRSKLSYFNSNEIVQILSEYDGKEGHSCNAYTDSAVFVPKNWTPFSPDQRKAAFTAFPLGAVAHVIIPALGRRLNYRQRTEFKLKLGAVIADYDTKPKNPETWKLEDSSQTSDSESESEPEEDSESSEEEDSQNKKTEKKEPEKSEDPEKSQAEEHRFSKEDREAMLSFVDAMHKKEQAESSYHDEFSDDSADQ